MLIRLRPPRGERYHLLFPFRLALPQHGEQPFKGTAGFLEQTFSDCTHFFHDLITTHLITLP